MSPLSLTRRSTLRASVLAATAATAASLGACSTAQPVAASDVPVGGGLVVGDLDAVITQPTAGVFHAFSATCTHGGCRVTTVEDGLIHCPCHGSTFDDTTGEVRQGPATRALPVKQVTVAGESLTIS